MFNPSNKKAYKLLNFNTLSSILAIPLASGICAFADSINMSSLCDDERWIIKDLIS